MLVWLFGFLLTWPLPAHLLVRCIPLTFLSLGYHISPDPHVYLDVSAQLCNISGQQGACIGKVNYGT